MKNHLKCALCSSEALEWESDLYTVCPACGTISQAHPESVGQQDYHQEIYHHGITSVERRWMRLIEEWAGDGKRLLDLGCGNGAFLDLAQSRGWQAVGIEKNHSSVDEARALGLSVAEADLDEWAVEDPGVYDVVRIWYVLEHVRRPGNLLRQASKAVKTGGLLVLAVPNDAGRLSRCVMKSPDDRFWEHPLHLHHFPPFGLEKWIGELGFELVLGESTRPAELMRGGNLPLNEAWEAAREAAPQLCRIFYKLGVGRGREMILRKTDLK